MAMEKQAEPTVTVVDSNQENNDFALLSKWMPGYKSRFPFAGAIALFCITIFACAAIAVLVISDNTSTTVWPQRIAPNIILSLLNALSSLALGVAVAQGVAIAWWNHAMKGSTVKQLHHQWELSQGISPLLLRPKSVLTSSIALAVLAVQLTTLNNILYQRSTSTYSGPDAPKQLTTIGIGAEEFPMTGYVVSNTSFGAQTNCACFMIGDSFTPVVNTWETSNGFFQGYNELFRYTDDSSKKSNTFEYCSGVCYSSFEAVGFEIDCVDQTNHTDIAIPAIAAYNAKGNSSAWTDLPIFNSSFSLEYATADRNYSRIMLDLQYFQSDDPYNPKSTSCPGTVFTKQCSLRPAIVSYPLKVTNFTSMHIINGVGFGVQQGNDNDMAINEKTAPPTYNKQAKQAEGFSVVRYLYPKDAHEIRSLTALGGIANAYSQFLSSTAAITYTGKKFTKINTNFANTFPGDSDWSLEQVGTLAQTMMYGPPNMGSCDCSFRSDALDTIIAGINQLTFLVATGMVDTQPFKGLGQSKKQAFPSSFPQAQVIGVDSNTTTSFRLSPGTATQLMDVVHYRTHFVYAGIAFTITILCILLTIPAYWHYGQLGRDVTLNPMEVASAFRSPLLADDRSTEERKDNIKTLIEHIGDRKIQYGFVDVDQQSESSSFMEDTHPVASPQTPITSPTLAQGETSRLQKRRSVRLAMGAPDQVRPTSRIYPLSPRLGQTKE